MILFLSGSLKAQRNEDPDPDVGNKMESLSERQDAEPEDDSYLSLLDQYRQHPLNMNHVQEAELESLEILSALQINSFLVYRNWLGKLLSIHELQAVPLWDLETIRKILPYIEVSRDESLHTALRERWAKGDHLLLARTAWVPEKSKGYTRATDTGLRYEGSPQKMFIRYSYNYKNLLQYGFEGEKDAGEPFLRKQQRYGFDFYSFHFFMRNTGVIRSLAIGDFTVNMGQGLTQWQSMSFTKSPDVLNIKRQAALLRPYHSAGEFNFHRGLGIILHKGNWESAAFISYRKISGHLTTGAGGRDVFSSFENSGYHRTASENSDRNNTGQFTGGGNISYSGNGWHVGINAIHFQFSRYFEKEDQAYNRYSFKGKTCSDYSLNYSYTFRNMHFFGEAAIDGKGHPAFVQGMLASLSANADMAILYRNIRPAYQSLYADAFTENSSPSNEKGIYMGISFRPYTGLRIDAYADFFIFPWLKYRTDAPSQGRDYFLQFYYQPSKEWYLYSWFKNSVKQINEDQPAPVVAGLATPVKKSWRLETSFHFNRNVYLKSRMEYEWLQNPGKQTETGFLGFMDIFCRWKFISGNMRLQYFETGGYDSRIYTYESDLLYNFSLPAYYDRGFRYYLNLNKKLDKLFRLKKRSTHITCWLKWGQTIYASKSSLGTGLDEIAGNRKSEIKWQCMVSW